MTPAQTLEEVVSSSHFISPVMQHLLGMEARIRLYPIYDDLGKGKEGFVLTKNNIYFPYGLPTIEHEISHMVEINDPNRWTMQDWGLAGCDGNFLEKASTPGLFAGAAREARVRAIQTYLEPKYPGLLNTYWQEALYDRLPFGRFKVPQDIDVWLYTIREHTIRDWNLDRIENAWKIRITHLQHWMETQ